MLSIQELFFAVSKLMCYFAMKRQKMIDTILTITGSDNTGGSGVQADIRAITELGGQMVSVITCITIQNTLGIQEFYDIPAHIVAAQIEAIGNDIQPNIVKIGMIRNIHTLSAIVNYLQRHKPRFIIYDPVVFSQNGDLLMESHLIGLIRQQLLPLCSLILLRNEEMNEILGNYNYDNIYILKNSPIHGYANILSTGIAYYLTFGNDIRTAIEKASEYIRIHTQKDNIPHSRSTDLYNDFTKSISCYLKQRSDVAYYADYLNVTPRYLTQVTNRICGLAPKAIIEQYLKDAIENELINTEKTIQEIAYEYGFSSQAHFSKFFKRITGYTPRNFRKITYNDNRKTKFEPQLGTDAQGRSNHGCDNPRTSTHC